MKVIELLIKISNGEIDINNKYQFSKDDYCTINDFFDRYIVDEENLNLEILEEKEIPEKVYYDGNDIVKKWIVNKINEIIDYLQYLKSKGE